MKFLLRLYPQRAIAQAFALSWAYPLQQTCKSAPLRLQSQLLSERPQFDVLDDKQLWIFRRNIRAAPEPFVRAAKAANFDLLISTKIA
jgi:hypothetical protein